ncbi:hypothetical protein F4X86_01270 [Candidatus Saccharibacteria bacterium]|nr:hypothetical protein [Candidatus Saccharibacteria bacterium]
MTIGRRRILLGAAFGLAALLAGAGAAIFWPGDGNQTGVDGGVTDAAVDRPSIFAIKNSETGDIYLLERTGRQLQLELALSAEIFKEIAPELAEEYEGWPLHASFLSGDILVTGGPRAVHVFEFEAGQWIVKQEVSFDNFPELVDKSVTPVPVALSADFLAVHAAGGDSDNLLIFGRDGGQWSLAHAIATTGAEGLSAKFNVAQAVIDGAALAVGVVDSDRDGVYIFDLGAEEWSLRQVVSPDALPDMPATFHVFSKLAFSDGRLAVAIDDIVYMLEEEAGGWALKQQIFAQDFPGLTGRTFTGVWTAAKMVGGTLALADSELLYVFSYGDGEWVLERNIPLGKQYGPRRETGSGHGVTLRGGLIILGKFAGSLEEGAEENVRVFVRDDDEWLLDKTLDL